jgi:hypothetical protein
MVNETSYKAIFNEWLRTPLLLQVYCDVLLPRYCMNIHQYLDVVWLIRTCDEKFSNVRAAVSVDLTAARYGLRTFDCVRVTFLIAYSKHGTHHCRSG